MHAFCMAAVASPHAVLMQGIAVRALESEAELPVRGMPGQPEI
jgi:hypothetical protein